MRRALTTTALFVASQLAAPAGAKDRALLVGVGDYAVDRYDLPGIENDIVRVTDALRVMGFDDTGIRTLRDADATADNIRRAMDEWLVDGVGEDDRVVFYYSGHGSRIPDTNGDESDGADEVLVAHEARRVRRNGRATLDGVVTDDEIADVIRRSASRRFLTVVDACHSGTMTRSIRLENDSLGLGSERLHSRVLEYAGMPSGGDSAFTDPVPLTRSVDGGESHFVSISAAGDNEKAIGTSRGGVFTIGLYEAIKNSAAAGHTLSLNEARDMAAAFIRDRLDENQVHTPVVTGSRALAEAPLWRSNGEPGPGPMWQRVEDLLGMGQSFHLGANQRRYRLDDVIELSLDVPERGYLNIVTVDANDVATVLFPNRFESDNRIRAGRLTFPGGASAFEFAAAPPLGPTLIVALVSEKPVDFRRLGIVGRLKSGEFSRDATFTELTHDAMLKLRGATVRARSDDEAPWLYASSVEFDVVGRSSASD